MKIFVLVLGIVQLCAASLKPQMHFTEVDHAIGGKFSDPFEVESFTACGHRALGRKAIGFRMRAKEGEEAGECRVLEEFEFFKENTEGDAFYFIADVRRKDATTCSANVGEESVMEVLSGGECGEGELCERWKKMRDTCKASGHQNCYKNADLPSTTTLEPKTTCPEKWHLEGEDQCCPTRHEYSEVYQKCLVILLLKPDLKTQEDVNAVCRSTGGDPVSIANAEQNEELRMRFVIKHGSAVIGYQIPVGKEWTKDGFQWVDGAENSYMNWWIVGSPNNYLEMDERMVYMSNAGDWDDTSVDYAITTVKRIICMSKAIPAATV